MCIKAEAETPKVLFRARGIEVLKGVSKAIATHEGWQPVRHHNPIALDVTKGNRNFAWEDLDEHQPEEEFSLQQKSHFGQLNPSAAGQCSVFGWSARHNPGKPCEASIPHRHSEPLCNS